MKCLTIVAFVCLGFLSPVASDSTGVKEDDTKETTHTTETHDHEETNTTRRKRSVFHLYNMVTCATHCNPLLYKGYGCYCGFLGSGMVVDGIDKCCKGHDWCYEHSNCLGFDQYLAPYRWKCNGGNPYCVATRGPLGGVNSCGHQLCECDREFVECLKQYPCPKTKAICMTSPWRYWQNLFMGLSTGSGMHHVTHHSSPSHSPSYLPPKEATYHTSPSPSSPSSPTLQEETYDTTSIPSSPSPSTQDEKHSPTSPSTLYQNTLRSPSSPPPLYQEPSSSPSSPSPPHHDDPKASPSPHSLSVHSSNSFHSQHVTHDHTPHHHHLNEAF